MSKGELLFTHFGLSGPLVLSPPAPICADFAREQYTCVIDLKPALEESASWTPAWSGSSRRSANRDMAERPGDSLAAPG